MQTSDLNISSILYEDENILLCDLVHDMKHYDIFPPDYDRYGVYFSNSVVGNSYMTLIRKDAWYIVHADTEKTENVANKIIQEIADCVRDKQDTNLLLLGMGNGNLHRRIDKLVPGVAMTTYEYYKTFAPIKEIVFPKQTEFHFVNIYRPEEVIKLDSKTYDIIVDDIMYNVQSNMFYYVNYLNDGGTMYFLNDWTRFDTPYSYSSITKNGSTLQLNNVSGIDQSIIEAYYNDINEFIMRVHNAANH